MRVRKKKVLLLSGVLAVVGALLLLTTFAGAASGSGTSQRVTWDIISLKFTTPPTFDPGGYAEAQTPAPATTFGPTETIRLTGHGTFNSPSSSGGKSFAVTGGGTWSIRNSAGEVTSSGTYKVTQLVQWEFAGFQTGTFIDNTGDTNERANGTAVLRIEFSDGAVGVLTVGCHGPGAPNHIFEGIATTKGFKTYYEVQDPAPGVDANRTLFHVDK